MLKFQDPVNSALKLQKIAFSVWGGSLIALILIIFGLNPNQSLNYIYIFLFLLFIFISSGLSLFLFWWNYYLLRRLLQIYDIYRLLTKSVITAAFITTILALLQTKIFNYWIIAIFIFAYGMFYLWHNSSED